jgi:hypothetical protein
MEFDYFRSLYCGTEGVPQREYLDEGSDTSIIKSISSLVFHLTQKVLYPTWLEEARYGRNQETHVRFLVILNLQDWFKENSLAGEVGVQRFSKSNPVPHFPSLNKTVGWS